MRAAEQGGAEVSLAVLAATLVDVVDFFPVTFLYGVSKFLFSALALAFCISLLVSFVVAMTVIPLFCSRFLKSVPGTAGTWPSRATEGEIVSSLRPDGRRSWGALQRRFQPAVQPHAGCLRAAVRYAPMRPGLTVSALMATSSSAWQFIRCWASPSSPERTPASSPST